MFKRFLLKLDKLLVGPQLTCSDAKNGVSNNKNTLLELTANTNYSNSVNNSRGLTAPKSTCTKSDDSGGENFENRFQVLRCDDPIDQGVQVAIKQKFKSLATKANEFAKQGEYLKAIEKFTEALRYDVTDHRIFSNRSYCYDKINCFIEYAISDLHFQS